MPDPPDGAAATVYARAPAVRLDQPRKNLEKSGFPGAVRSEKREGMSAWKSEGDVVERGNPAKAMADPVSPQHRCGQRARSDRRVSPGSPSAPGPGPSSGVPCSRRPW